MSEPLQVALPGPQYAIGTMVLALINHQPRYARIQSAYLQASFVLDAEGVRLVGELRWEYDVQVINEPASESEQMVIAERTILFSVDADNHMSAGQ
jgi:hypothetical protein